MEKGYEKTYNWVKGLLKNCDFSDSSKRRGLKQIAENKKDKNCKKQLNYKLPVLANKHHCWHQYITHPLCQSFQFWLISCKY